MSNAFLLKNRKQVPYIIWAFTAVVFALVSVLHEIDFGTTFAFTAWQPAFHAAVNGTCFVLLIMALVAIKGKNIERHEKLMSMAMVLSVVFLLSYVVYHATSSETKYGGEYTTLYYIVLISHIVLAGLSLPFILFAYFYGSTDQIKKHKRLVKITYPLWLYVTFTGVLVYLFLMPYYA